jgi:hypothetical protein
MNMKRTANRLAIVAGSLAVVSVLAAACSSGGGGGGGGTTTVAVTKADGSAANFACNHSFSDGPAQGAISQKMDVVAQGATSSPPLPGTRIALLNPGTATTSGVFAISDSSGNATMATTGNTRIGFKNHHDPDTQTYIDTYEYNRLTTGTAGAGTNVMGTRVITSTVYGVFGGLLGAQPSDLAGKVAVAGAINDCDGDTVAHATVTIPGNPPTCATAATYPCVAYFRSGVPNRNAKDSDVDGQFVVLAAAPGALTITVNGSLTDGGTAESLGELNIFGVADTVAIGTSAPLSN